MPRSRILPTRGKNPPLVYCTAKQSSAGCTASIGTSNTQFEPVSGANDYSVVVSNVQELKNGHVFVGVNGALALPFLGGTLCVQPPTKRGPTLNSGGSGPLSCDGVYNTVVNDGQSIPIGLDAGPGGSAWYQLWYRDPNNGAGLDAGMGNSGWYQYWYRDAAGGPGQLGTALSNAVQLDFQ